MEVTHASLASLPSGYRFHPTDRELIMEYLLKISRGESLRPEGAIFECDVYGDANEWMMYFEYIDEDILFFLTKLKKKTAKSQRIDRTTNMEPGKVKAINRYLMTKTFKLDLRAVLALFRVMETVVTVVGLCMNID